MPRQLVSFPGITQDQYGDVSYPDAFYQGGYHFGGQLKNLSTVRVEWDYTQTEQPANDGYVGTAFISEWNSTIDSSTPFIGAISQANRVLGPAGIFAAEGEIKYSKDQTPVGFSPITFMSQMFIKNTPGQARRIVPSWTFANNNVYVADGAACTLDHTDALPGGAGFVDNPIFTVANGGTFTPFGGDFNTEQISFASLPFFMDGVEIGDRTAFYAADINASANGLPIVDLTGAYDPITGVGTINRNRAFYVPHLVFGAEQVGLENHSNTLNVAFPVELASASDDIPLEASTIELNNTSGGTLALTSVPTMPSGYEAGQRIVLINVSAHNITLQGDASLSGSNFEEDIILTPGVPKEIMWTSYNGGKWVGIGA